MRALGCVLVLSLVLLSGVAMADDGPSSKTAQADRIATRTAPDAKAGSKVRSIMGRATRSAKDQVPGLMSFQGTLTDDVGMAMDTTVSMAFSIYDDSTGGSVIWTETQPNVQVDNGLFNVLLGSVNSISDTVFDDPERWLGVQVGGDPELAPRQRIATVGYSFRAMEADTADYARSTAAGVDGDWTVVGDHIYSAVPGNVGIGTSNPTSLLEVAGDARIDEELQVRSVRGRGQVSIAFMQIVESPNTPVPIHDNFPPGDSDTLTFPDLGTAENLIVSIDITNSDITGLEVYLTDPDLNVYTLYDRDSSGTALVTSYPYPTPTVSGDLTSWIGQNPQGDWILKVIDWDFLNNNWDGQINSWSVSITNTGGNTVHVRSGNFVVDGEVGIGTADPARELHVNNVMRLQPRADAPSDPSKGDMYIRDSDGKLMVYDGSVWQPCW